MNILTELKTPTNFEGFKFITVQTNLPERSSGLYFL